MKAFQITVLCIIVLQSLTNALIIHSPIHAYGKYNNPNEQSKYPYGIQLTSKDITEAISFSASVIEKMQRFENNLEWSDHHVKTGTPAHGQYISDNLDHEAHKWGSEAFLALKTTVYLTSTYCYKHRIEGKDCAKMIRGYGFYKRMPTSCTMLQKRCSEKALQEKYRLIDGGCNNYENGAVGKSYTPYARLIEPHYSDGLHTPRRALSKQPLPSPRHISNSLVKDVDAEDPKATVAVMQWAQFIEHDLSRTATSTTVHTEKKIECCSESGYKLAPRYIHPFCYPIDVPMNDSYYKKHFLNCMSYVRSVPVLKHDCSIGAIEQMNQATHHLDGSQIYGNTRDKSNTLRTFKKGQLITTKNNYLPLSENPVQDCQVKAGESCFKSGDPRVNFQPQLTVMHTLWFREHNRIANKLADMHSDWSDEHVFQEARRIVMAEMQHITYSQFVASILGKSWNDDHKKWSEYYERDTTQVTNSFANAAIRSISSMINGKINLYDENRTVISTIDLEEHFNQPKLMLGNADVLDNLIRGLATQSSQKVDINFPDDLSNKLYLTGKFGYDSLSLDIQRGRDHGLPGYTEFRRYCGFPGATIFHDLRDVMTKQNRDALSKVYNDAKDIDLIVGGLMENTEKDSIFGPTFKCLITDQLIRTRRADKYFYANSEQPVPFTNQQLNAIRKVTLARIFCDNSNGIEKMQPNVFEKISASNALVSCSSDAIPKLNLNLWA